jgi:peptidoglycan/LPS O-acetylase OafA/YrhL
MEIKRLKELDILRAIAYIFVVEQHVMGGYSNVKGISYFYYEIFKFFYTLAKPAVSIFLCISSISLFYVYSKNLI